jgi:hypothetical protein
VSSPAFGEFISAMQTFSHMTKIVNGLSNGRTEHQKHGHFSSLMTKMGCPPEQAQCAAAAVLGHRPWPALEEERCWG